MQKFSYLPCFWFQWHSFLIRIRHRLLKYVYLQNLKEMGSTFAKITNNINLQTRISFLVCKIHPWHAKFFLYSLLLVFTIKIFLYTKFWSNWTWIRQDISKNQELTDKNKVEIGLVCILFQISVIFRFFFWLPGSNCFLWSKLGPY